MDGEDQEKRKQQELARQNVLDQILSPEARERRIRFLSRLFPLFSSVSYQLGET